ncbi:hypothetical protein P8C59_001106 [Phyllachora maydis]|uniref:Reverse transcriptase Ty1/copia-type domain-containing protein n=1 Tax=Phyllachora maydis TaxID=1825666 RepID=A0AAD9HZ15_9PEZI|nr:hypothetical protein P8C59_001106 [Phyllachora maydis]
MADQAKGKGIAPKRASNPADLGQSSRPLLPIRTLSEDKEDGEDYSEVIEVLKQHIKSHKRDSVSAIKNISSTLAFLTNSSNATAATTGKTSYSPRFDPFSGTMDLDSPPCPPRKEPHLGPAINSATSNLDPLIDIGSKEGFKDTITCSIVKELSKKAYTIPDDKSKKKDVYNEFHALTFSTYRKGLLAFNAEFNGYLAKLTIAKIDIDPSLILNQQARMLGLIASSLNIEYLMADILEESRNPAIEAYRAAYIANSSNSTPNSNSNPSKKGKNKKKGKKKASYNVEGQNYSAKSAEQASFMLGSYNLAIEEEEEFDSSSNSRFKKRKDFKGKGLKTSSNKAKYEDNQPRRRPRDPALYNSWLYNTGSTDHISNSKERFTTFTPNIGQLRPINTGNGPISPAGIGSITLEVLSRKAPPTYTKLVLDNVLYLPNININIISRVRHYDSGGCLIKETLYGGDRRCIAVLDFKKSGFFLDVKGSSKPILHANFAFPLGFTSYNTTKSIEPQRNKIVVEIPSNSIRKEDYRPIIKDAIVSKAIEPNKRYKLRNSLAKGTTLEGIGPSLRGKRPCRPTREPKPLTGTRDLPCMLREPVIEGNKVEKAISSPTLKEPNIEGELVDLDLDLEGAISPYPSNLNTEKPISIEIGPSKLEPYESSSNSKLDKPLLDKPINPPITNEPLNNSDLISEGDKMQLDYYKLLAKTSSYILSFVYKARKRVISKDKLGVFKFLPRSLLPSNRKLITCRNVLKVKKDAKNRPIKYKSQLVARGFMQVEGLDYTVTYASTSILPTWRILLAIDLGVFYNAKTCYFIVTYIDDCLFIGPNIGYITDLKKRLNKVYAIEDLGPAAYFLGLSRSLNRPTKSHLNAAKNLFKYLNSTKDYSICFSYNGNTVADLGPKLSNSSNTITKLSRDFYSKEGPRPLTTTSTTIVDSRNSKGSSRTSIINNSLVPIGFSDSHFVGDKATSKSTYGYLYKLASRPISWKTKRATTIALSTLEAETDGLTEAIREVQ